MISIHFLALFGHLAPVPSFQIQTEWRDAHRFTAIPTVNGVRSQSDLCSKLNLTKCLEEDSPHPRSSALSSPTSSARRRRPAPSSWSSSGPTSRRTTSRLETKGNFVRSNSLTFVCPLYPGPRQQAVLRPRQEDGQGLRLREDPRLQYGQGHRTPSLLGSLGQQRFIPHFYTSTKK